MRAFVVEQPRTEALRALNYAPELEKLRRSRSLTAVPLGSMVSGIGESYGTVFTRRDCSPEAGVELLTQTDMFASEPDGRIIRIDSMRNPALHRVQRWQVLIAGAGQMGEGNLFGRSIIADGRLTSGYLGPHAVALTFNEPGGLENLWTYAFLNTKAGLLAVKTAAFGTSIPGLRLDLLKSLPIPIADSGTMTRVASLVSSAVVRREDYARFIQQSRAAVMAVPAIREATHLCQNRTRRSIVWTGPLPSLSAWNFAAGGGAVGLLRDCWRSRLRDVLQPEGIFNGARVARVDCFAPHGINFCSQRDIFMIRPVGRRIVRPATTDRLLFVPKDALLVGSRGQMNQGSIFGRVELASYTESGCGVTEDILRMNVLEGFREAAYAFLSTGVGQWLLKSAAIGTSIPAMRIDLLNDLPFPDPGVLPVEEIKHLVRMAETARIEATKAETEAIRIIEEEVLPKWLE